MLSRRRLYNSLILKLIGAFALVILIGALVIYFLTTQATQNAFRLYTTQNSQLWAEQLAPDFANFYAQTNSWQGVEAFMQANLSTSDMAGMMNGMGAGRGAAGRGQGRGNGGAGFGWMGGMGQRLILADAQGRVVADTGNELTGSQLSTDEIASGAPVTAQDQRVGTLIATPANLISPSNPASTFLTSVNRSIFISVIVAGVISLILVLLFSIQMTAPIRQMQKAARAIAEGRLDQRVSIQSRDELGALGESFNHMAGSLAQAEAQRQKLIADVAHELRTPLAVIQANTEGIQDGVLPLDIEQINAIHAETLLLGRLINDLRLISIAESGELRLERQPADLGGLLEEAVERFQPQCAQKGVELTLSFDPQLPQAAVDVDRFNQVLNNLISNALRYTPEGGKISLQARQRQGSRSAVEVSVTDTGPGIAADDLPWVFDRFYRADKSRARTSGGTGLGLAIAKQLVEAHGGRIWAESPASLDASLPKGTRMTFILPISGDSSPQAQARQPLPDITEDH